MRMQIFEAEVRRRIAGTLRKLAPWIVHMTISQIIMLNTFAIPRWAVALGSFDCGALDCFDEAQVLANAASDVQFPGMAQDYRYIPIQVADLYLHAAVVLEASEDAWKTLKAAAKKFKKSGTALGRLSKAEKDRGFTATLPTTAPPEVEGTPLFSIVGTVPANGPLSGGAPSSGGRQPPRAGADGGDLFRALQMHFASIRKPTEGRCLCCLYLNRAEAFRHNASACPLWSEAWAAAADAGVLEAARMSRAAARRTSGYRPYEARSSRNDHRDDRYHERRGHHDSGRDRDRDRSPDRRREGEQKSARDADTKAARRDDRRS